MKTKWWECTCSVYTYKASNILDAHDENLVLDDVILKLQKHKIKTNLIRKVNVL